MPEFLTYERDQIPLAKLPYGFKKRLTALAPLDDLNNIRQTCFEYNELCSPRPEVRDQVYITDDETVYQWASKEVLLFSIFRFMYWLLRWIIDGTSFRPTWHSVLTVDEVIKMGRPIYVTDTLVLNCRSLVSLARVIAYIRGPYTRLMIHGEVITLGQLKWLMKGTVKKVGITAYLWLLPDERDDAVQLIRQHVRDFEYNFWLVSTADLITEVKTAADNDDQLHAESLSVNHCNVMHRTMRMAEICFNVYVVQLVFNIHTLSILKLLGIVKQSGFLWRDPIINVMLLNPCVARAFLISYVLLYFFAFKSAPDG